MVIYRRVMCSNRNQLLKIFYSTADDLVIVILRRKHLDTLEDAMSIYLGYNCIGGGISADEVRREIEEKLNSGDWDAQVVNTSVVVPRTTDMSRISDALSKL